MILDWLPALLVPVVIWVVWRLQAWSVQGLRGSMVRLTRGNRGLYHTISWFGTLLHEISHALVLLLSGHGIRGFNVRSTTGHVLPARLRRDPLSTLAFGLAALAPQFFVPFLVILGASLVGSQATGEAWGLSMAWSAGPGWSGFLDALEGLARFPLVPAKGLLRMDLATWQGILFLAIVLLGAPGTRPSHVKEKGQSDGDIAVLRARIKSQPVPFLALLVVVVLAHPILMWLAPAAYWLPITWVWILGVTGIFIALFGSLVWATVYRNSRIQWPLAWIPLAVGVGLQVVLRWQDTDAWIVNPVSFGAWIALAWTLAAVAQKRDVYSRF
ncbi:MAG: hypothetical protein ACPHK8_01355 [Thermoplasmatota archaeon]